MKTNWTSRGQRLRWEKLNVQERTKVLATFLASPRRKGKKLKRTIEALEQVRRECQPGPGMATEVISTGVINPELEHAMLTFTKK